MRLGEHRGLLKRRWKTVLPTNSAEDPIFIDVGARARFPDIEGLDQVDYLTNSSMMELDFLPEHLIIIGGSYIGLEFAQMYRRFGAEVTVVEMGDRLIGREDDDVSDAVREILEGEGVHIRWRSQPVDATQALNRSAGVSNPNVLRGRSLS